MENFRCPDCWEEWFVISNYQKGVEHSNNTRCKKCKAGIEARIRKELLKQPTLKPVKTPPLTCPNLETYARFAE